MWLSLSDIFQKKAIFHKWSCRRVDAPNREEDKYFLLSIVYSVHILTRSSASVEETGKYKAEKPVMIGIRFLA